MVKILIAFMLLAAILLPVLSACGQAVTGPETEAETETDKGQTVESGAETGPESEKPTESETREVETEEPVDITIRPVMDENMIYDYVSKTWQTGPSNQDREIMSYDAGNATGNYRFADRDQYIIYKFDLTGAVDPEIKVDIGNNYKIEVSTDRENWTLVYNWLAEHEVVKDRSNHGTYAFKPFDYVNLYGMIYVRFTDADPDDGGWGSCFTSISVGYYQLLSKTTNQFNLDDSGYALLQELLDDLPESEEVDAYTIAYDGGLVYNPISREKADQLDKYASASCTEGTIQAKYGTKDITLKYWIPKNATAYDAVPVKYEITTSGSVTAPIYVDAVATDEDKNDPVYYDLLLPGTVDLEWEYLGYVNGTNKAGNRPKNRPDVDNTVLGKQYPQYNTTDLIQSGTVQTADITWFKFAFTNTGDTVLDGDGNGTFCLEAVLYRKENGTYKKVGTLENLYSRIFNPMYPGDVEEVYFTFPDAGRLYVGDYRLEIKGIVRNETVEGYGRTIWGGDVYTTDQFDFTVAAQQTQTEPNEVVARSRKTQPTRNTWLHTYEEFMGSYDSWLRGVASKQADTLYLQCAPWTECVDIKLIIGNGDTLVSARVPIAIETESLSIKLNKDCNAYVVRPDGTRFPAITVQSMADMRGNVQLGPDAAGNVINNLLRFQSCGINVVNTTAAFEFDSNYGLNIANNIDACWFSLDVMRRLGLKVEGWISYPYNTPGNLTQANSLYKMALTGGGFGDTDLAMAAALNAKWQFLKWGDNYWIGGNDTVVLDLEDTRGWMRVDYNARSPLSSASLQRFRLFLMDLYHKDIDELNEDWGTDYESFQSIDPSADASNDHDWWKFQTSGTTFEEWSLPLALLDCFRTLERAKDYEMILDNLSDTIPTAKINLRTEGANWISVVDPYTENSHYRHVYYSQRRCGIIPELMSRANVLYAHSDYTTLPYTPSEVAELTRNSVSMGIVPMLLPQFNRMRDIAVNSKYGTSFTYEYNLAGDAQRGAYINTLVSVYEWFKATYENGGVPGLLAQDYLCDGYMTSTQYREIQFFTEKLQEAINTPEGQAWSKNFDQNSNVLSGSKGTYSYDADYVDGLIQRVKSAH